MTTDFDLRLVGYQPLGARIGPIPDLGFTVTDTPAGPTLAATVSTAVYGTLPTYLEVAVEFWQQDSQTWTEGRDSRYAITQFDADDRDKTGTVGMTGLGLGAFLLASAQLKGVDPYADLTGTSELARSTTSASVSGTTFTWGSHILAAGDRVRIKAKGNAKSINTGSVYYVKNPTASTFQLARGNATSAAINAGHASNISMERVCTRIVFTDTHLFKKSDAVTVLGGKALGLSDGTRYYVVNPTPATIQVADKPGGKPIELAAANTNVAQVYRYLDGQRVFTGATPGTVMDAVFLEARTRGWGQNPAGVDQVFHGWTTDADSTGTPWVAIANDPETPGVGLGFQPGTPGTQVLQALMDNRYAEWYMQGRTIHLVNWGTGEDKTTDADTYAADNVVAATPAVTITPASIAAVLQNITRLPGTGEFFTSQVHPESNGDESVRLSRISATGALLDQMVLTRAGHGTKFEVTQEAGVTTVWLTWQRDSSGNVVNDFVRFPYAAGTFTRAQVAGLTVVMPGGVGGPYRLVAFDLLNNLAAVRTSSGTTDSYALHPLANVKAGNLSAPSVTLTLGQSANFGADGLPTLQGFATFRGSLFRYTGAPSDSATGDPFMLTEYRWSDGAPVRALNLSGIDKTNGKYYGGKAEPEGLGLYNVDGSAPRLYMTVTTGQPGDHRYDVFTLALLAQLPPSKVNPVRIGTTASSVKVNTDLTGMRNAITVRGTGPVQTELAASAGQPWGRLEVYETAQGATSVALAQKQAQTDLAANQAPTVAYTVTEAAQEAAWVPLASFDRGDWVAVWLTGSGWTRLRCAGWSFTKAPGGAITVTTNLETIKRTLLTKQAKAIVTQSAGLSSTSTPGPLLQETDNRAPAAPQNVTGTSMADFGRDASATATVSVRWDAVTSDVSGGDVTAAEYEVWTRADGNMNGSSYGRTAGLSLDVPSLPSGRYYLVSVRARSTTGAWGELSDEVEVQTAYPSSVLYPPSAPVVVSTLGSLTITWDGMLVDPDDGPTPAAGGFSYLTVQRSTDGSTWITESQTLAGPGVVTDLGLKVGATYQYRLVAVDSLGNSSAPSPVVSCVVVGIDVAQINAAFQKSMDDVAAVSSNAQSIANQSAATAGQALTAANNAGTSASNALTAANGKNRNTYSTAGASGSGTAAGDLWFQVNGSGQITGQWTWTGSAWQSNQLTGAVITNLDAGSITTGTLSAARISTRSISASQLAVADFTNLVPAPHFDFGGNPFWQGYAYTGGDVPNGSAWVCNGRDHTSTFDFPVKAGDSFYIEMTARNISGGPLGVNPSLWAMNKDGNGGNGWAPWDLLNGTVFKGTVAVLAGGWSRYSYQLTIPSTWTDIAKASVYMQIAQNPTGGATQWAVADLLYRRAANAQLIVDGAITANAIAATAIDGKTITGATIQTASNVGTNGQGGVILNSGGITGYNSGGQATFRVDNAGNTSMTGTVHATSGSIDGALTIGGGGGLYTNPGNYPRSRFDTYGLNYDQTSAFNVGLGQIDGSSIGLTWALNNVIQGQLWLNNGGGASLWASQTMILGGAGHSLTLASDTNGQFTRSPAVWSRTYAGVSSDPGNSGSLGTTGFVVVTNNGTLGISRGYVQFPDAYNRTVTGRTAVVNPNGTLGYASSSRRTKNLHTQTAMDDAAVDKWLTLPTWEFDYKADPAHKPQLGVVAEEVVDAGYEWLVYRDESPDSETPGQIDGFAYERMGVMNHLALKRLYARLVEAENTIRALTGGNPE